LTTTVSAHRGAYLLYLNGYAVPCPSINVSCGVGQIPEASFALAPHPSLQRLGVDDRVEVTVFYLDDIITPEEPAWRLLFEGEIVGWSYSNTPLGTKMQFSAIADISIIKQLQYAYMTANDVVGQALKPAADVATAVQPGAFYPFSLFKKGLIYGRDGKDEKVTPDIERPFEILYNAVKGMIDVSLNLKVDPATGKKFSTPPAIPLINFFARWARKRNFQNRFVALPVFEDTADKTKGVFPILASIQDDSAMQTLAESLSTQVGDQGSMWDVLQYVFTKVYFEIAMLPTPPAYRVRISDGYIQGIDSKVTVAGGEELTTPMRLGNYFVKPQMFFGVPPTCNVFFPTMIRGFEFGENYMAQPTRMYVSDGLITGMMKDDAFVSAALTVGYPEIVNATLREKLKGSTGTDERTRVVGQMLNTGKNVLIYPEEFFKGPVVERMSLPSWFTILMNKNKANKQTAAAAETGTAPAPAKLQDLFDTYVRYEYYRRRYEKRGGTLSLQWNPYVVPGFPCFIFDRRAAPLDCAGYVQSVSWSLSTTSMSTSVSFGYARTLQEFLENTYTESQIFGTIMGAGPAEPLPTVRTIIQDPAQAETFYKGLFYGRSEWKRGNEAKPASALLHTLVGARLGDQVKSLEMTQYEGKEVSMDLDRGTDGKFDFNVALEPLVATKHLFDDHEASMQYVARPICTMQEYIRFRTGLYPSLTPDGTDLPAPYWRRIYSLRQGPAATVPTEAMIGAKQDAPSSSGQAVPATVYTGARSAVPSTFPQTRTGWDKIIETYVQILNQAPPLT